VVQSSQEDDAVSEFLLKVVAWVFRLKYVPPVEQVADEMRARGQLRRI
jgi:hypothetical protein